MKRPVQYFTEEYLEQCKKFSSEEIIEFLESFRLLQAELADSKNTKSKLISLKVSESLLTSFRTLAQAQGIKYQTQIKNLMTEWVKSGKLER